MPAMFRSATCSNGIHPGAIMFDLIFILRKMFDELFGNQRRGILAKSELEKSTNAMIRERIVIFYLVKPTILIS
jgi:hypothetical protein